MSDCEIGGTSRRGRLLISKLPWSSPVDMTRITSALVECADIESIMLSRMPQKWSFEIHPSVADMPRHGSQTRSD